MARIAEVDRVLGVAINRAIIWSEHVVLAVAEQQQSSYNEVLQIIQNSRLCRLRARRDPALAMPNSLTMDASNGKLNRHILLTMINEIYRYCYRRNVSIGDNRSPSTMAAASLDPRTDKSRVEHHTSDCTQ